MTLPEETEWEQRRNNVRVKVALPLQVETLYNGKPYSANVHTLDISCGGLRMRFPVALSVGTDVLVMLPISPTTQLTLKATVLRVHTFEPLEVLHNAPYKIGVRFYPLDTALERQLARFVFQQERLHRKAGDITD